MPKYLKSRSPLSPSDVNEFFDTHGHLNYRYTMLWRHKRATKIAYGDAICAFESSLIVCRVFMEFLGLGVRNTAAGPVLMQKQDYFSLDGITTDEVKVIDIGGTFANISRLTAAESEVLAKVYHMAHKSTAHLTFKAPHVDHPGLVHQCIPVVDRLLRENLYDIVGKNPHQHTM